MSPLLLSLLACGKSTAPPQSSENSPTQQHTGWPSSEEDSGTDLDGDGWTVEAGDCDDGDRSVLHRALRSLVDGAKIRCGEGGIVHHLELLLIDGVQVLPEGDQVPTSLGLLLALGLADQGPSKPFANIRSSHGANNHFFLPCACLDANQG